MTLSPPSSRGLSSGGGTVTGAVTIAPTADEPTVLAVHSPSGALAGHLLADISNFAGTGGLDISVDGTSTLFANSASQFALQVEQDGSSAILALLNASGQVVTVSNAGLILTKGGVKTNVITSGALPTATLVSGTGAQLSTTRDVFSATPVTFNAAAADATCAVAVSPDNNTYSALGTITHKTGLANGEIELVTVNVPAAWYLKLTVTNASLGTTTYY